MGNEKLNKLFIGFIILVACFALDRFSKIYILNILNNQGLLIIHRHKSSEEIYFSKNYELHREKNYGQSKILILRRI